MAKSNGRTQRPQRTARNSAKANVETKAETIDEVEAVEDTTTEDPIDEVELDSEAVADEDSSSKNAKAQTTEATDSAQSDAAATDDADVDAAGGVDANAADDAEVGKTKSDKKSGSKQAGSAKPSAKKSETAKSETAKSETAKSGAKKTDAAKGSAGKRTSRSGNPAKRPQGRKTAAYTSQSGQQTIKPNPRWFLPVLIGLLLIGLIWLVAFYVSQGAFPVEAWGNWNILIGFAFFVAGLIMSTRWR